jgi:hypothetical protein
MIASVGANVPETLLGRSLRAIAHRRFLQQWIKASDDTQAEAFALH